MIDYLLMLHWAPNWHAQWKLFVKMLAFWAALFLIGYLALDFSLDFIKLAAGVVLIFHSLFSLLAQWLNPWRSNQ